MKMHGRSSLREGSDGKNAKLDSDRTAMAQARMARHCEEAKWIRSRSATTGGTLTYGSVNVVEWEEGLHGLGRQELRDVGPNDLHCVGDKVPFKRIVSSSSFSPQFHVLMRQHHALVRSRRSRRVKEHRQGRLRRSRKLRKRPRVQSPCFRHLLHRRKSPGPLGNHRKEARLFGEARELETFESAVHERGVAEESLEAVGRDELDCAISHSQLGSHQHVMRDLQE